MSRNLAQLDHAQALVSVIVITYNSSRYVLDTLESIKSQDYSNIELIVSDDCSADDTVDLVEQWFARNRERFFSVALVRTPANAGIAPNCNNGLAVANGVWIKLIAGDDILLPNCISVNMAYVHADPAVDVMFSAMVSMVNGEIACQRYPLESQRAFFTLDADQQHALLLERNHVWLAPASFIRREIQGRSVRFDERYPFCEDHPLWLRLTREGVKLFLLDEATVVYRQDDSITRVSDRWISLNYYQSIRRFYFAERYRYIKDWRLVFQHLQYFLLQEILIRVFGNRQSWLARKFNGAYRRVMRPVAA